MASDPSICYLCRPVNIAKGLWGESFAGKLHFTKDPFDRTELLTTLTYIIDNPEKMNRVKTHIEQQHVLTMMDAQYEEYLSLLGFFTLEPFFLRDDAKGTKTIECLVQILTDFIRFLIIPKESESMAFTKNYFVRLCFFVLMRVRGIANNSVKHSQLMDCSALNELISYLYLDAPFVLTVDEAVDGMKEGGIFKRMLDFVPLLKNQKLQGTQAEHLNNLITRIENYGNIVTAIQAVRTDGTPSVYTRWNTLLSGNFNRMRWEYLTPQCEFKNPQEFYQTAVRVMCTYRKMYGNDYKFEIFMWFALTRLESCLKQITKKPEFNIRDFFRIKKNIQISILNRPKPTVAPVPAIVQPRAQPIKRTPTNIIRKP